MNTVAKWALAVTLVAPCSAFGATIAYNVNFTMGGQPVTGVIDTDGKSGVLAPSDITGGMIIDSLGSFTIGTANVFGPGFGLNAVGSSLVFNPTTQAAPCGPTAECGVYLSTSTGPFQDLGIYFNPSQPASEQLTLFADGPGTSNFTEEVANQAVTIATVVPLPRTSWLLLTGLASCGLLGRRGQKQLPI